MKGKIKLLSRNLKLERKKSKSVQIDLLVDVSGEKINIELTNSSSSGVADRNLVYASKVHGSQLKYKDNEYAFIKSTLQILLNNFRCNESNIKETYYYRSESGKILSKKVKIDMVDIVLGKETWYTNREERLARWCMILTVETLEGLKEAIGEDFMEPSTKKKLIDEVEKYSSDDEMVTLYMELPRAELEKNTYIAEAKQEGETEERIAIAKNLKKSGIDPTIISENTGLSISEIEEL